MASANLAAVERVLELWNGLDPDPEKRRDSPELRELLGFFSEDVEFAQATSFPGRQGVQGQRQLARVWEDWLRAWTEHRSEIQEVQERGDRVLVLSLDSYVGRDGLEVENHGGAIFTLRDGLIVRFESFTDQDEARRAFEA